MSLNASKIYGPKGIGLLYVRSGTKIRPLVFGGGQENNLRSGTENVPGIVGFAMALEIAQEESETENTRLIELNKYFSDRLSKKVTDISNNGPKLFYAEDRNPHKVQKQLQRLPNNINIAIKNVEGEALMLYLDAHDIEVATGSACATTSGDPSHVLEAIGLSPQQAKQAIRITLGKQTNKSDLDHVIEVLSRLVPQLRKTYRE
jgi:cysteine desulfurase